MRNISRVSITVILISVFIILFIIDSNNHNECETRIESSIENNGEKIMTKTHVCKEKFSI